jgi:lipoprotein-releasing system permease protein
MRWFELLIGVRYLVRLRRSPALAAAALLGGATLLSTAAYVGLGGRPGVGTVVVLAAGLMSAAVGLLNFFSVFTMVSIMGVVLGVAALTTVLSVTGGFQEEFQRKILGVNAHVIVLKYGVDFNEHRSVVRTIRTLPGVVGAAPFVFNEMMISRGDELSGVLIKGVDPAQAGDVLDLPRVLERGSVGALAHTAAAPPVARPPLGPSGDVATAGPVVRPPLPGIIIGRSLAQKLGASIGDEVRLVSPLAQIDQSFRPAAGQVPRARDFRIVGQFYSGFDEYDRRLVYLSLRDAQAFYTDGAAGEVPITPEGVGDVVTGVEVKLADVTHSRAMARRIAEALGRGPYKVVDWKELNHNLFAALQLQKVVISLCLGLIIVVAMFNIVAALTMMVLQKVRAVAILRSMGTTSAAVGRIFQVAGMTIGLLGTGGGLALGWLMARIVEQYRYALDPKVYLIDRLPVRIASMEFLVAGAATLLLCLLATLYPALRAAGLRPVDGLRFD